MFQLSVTRLCGKGAIQTDECKNQDCLGVTYWTVCITADEDKRFVLLFTELL
jgi:hypothetical protein